MLSCIGIGNIGIFPDALELFFTISLFALSMADNPEGPERYASSVTYLVSLVRAEMDIYKELGNYADVLEERLKLIKLYMKDYQESTLKITEQLDPETDPWLKASHAAAHPLIAYRTVRRFSHEFQKIIQNIRGNNEKRLEDFITSLGGESDWPTKIDNEDRMEALLRLHYFYNLDLEEFTNGIIAGISTNVQLPTHQIFEIAEYAINEKFYSLAMDWLRLTESRIRREDPPDVAMEAVTNAYKRNIDLHDMYYKNSSKRYRFSKPLDGSLHNAKTWREIGMEIIPLSIADHPQNLSEHDVEFLALERYGLNHYVSLGLCNGENYQTEAHKSQLTCRYDTSQSHYYGHINPLKVEVLNKDPLLIQIYDVIADTWISNLIEKSYTKLHWRPPLGNDTYSTPRVASYAYLTDDEIVDTPISRRIELITKLNVVGELASDPLQITAYATGGHVGLHYDSLEVESNTPEFYEKGDRVMTFLIYLNDGFQGGLTSFPILRTHVKPVKGSVLVFYTSLKNGDMDVRMIHEACPVILGHKWIATKSSYLNENFLKRPCDLNSSL